MRLAISIVDPVATSELNDPRLIATWEPAVTFSPVPPEIADRWIAVDGEADTWMAVCVPLHETVSSSRTTGQAHDETTMPFWFVDALPTVRFESSIPLEAGTFEIVIGPDEVSIVTGPGPERRGCAGSRARSLRSRTRRTCRE